MKCPLIYIRLFFFREGGVMTKIYMATILHIKVVKKETF